MFIKGMIKDCYLAKQPKITDNTYNVSITGDTDDLILYTMDGTDPIINGKVYNAPFRVDKDCIVEARAVNEWSYSSSAFADVKKSKTEIKLLTQRYKDYRLKGGPVASFIYDSPFYYQYEDGRDEWTLFLCIGYCISLNANLYTATYTTASGNTEGFKISVKNGDLYFDVYREGVIDESIVLSEGFGVSSNAFLESPVAIQYLIINSNGQINGEQKFKPIVANGKPTFPQHEQATIGDTDLAFGFYDYCIYSGIKEELEDFYITEASVGKVELYPDDDSFYIQARGRGNIYITDHYVSEFIGVKPSDGYLYTGYDFNRVSICTYSATAYGGDGRFPSAGSTTQKTIYHTVILRQDINASNIEDGEKIFALDDDKTIFLHFKRFVPDSYGSEVSLCQVLDENDNITHEIVLTTGTGFQVKHNGEYKILYSYDSTQPLNYLVAINKEYISLVDENYTTNSVYYWYDDVPSNPKIKINSTAVSMPSDWEIGRIAVSDSGKLLAASIFYQVLYEPLYD